MNGNEPATADAEILEQAIDWHLAQSDMPETRWHDFVIWLEAAPAHAAAYDRVAAADRVIAEARFPVLAANDDTPMPGGRGWLWGAGAGAIAAALLAALILPVALRTPSAPFEIETRAGEHRTVRLADGTSIAMNGDTLLRLDRARPRAVELDRGEATLHVRHDAANPFTITSRGLSVQDVGTVFDLMRDGERLSVAVAEGAVTVEPRREAVTLRGGEALEIHAGRAMTRSPVDPQAVGGWRSGMLSFNAEPLAGVAAALYRNDGATVVLQEGLSHQPFTGTIRLTGVADRDVPHLATLIGATWRRDGKRWILASGRAPR